MSTKASVNSSTPGVRQDSAPPADDRQEDEGSPGRIRNWSTLKSIWRDRDVQYAQAIKPLTEAQIECIRIGRVREAKDLRPEEQGHAGIVALAWYPPEHGQGFL